ncbi:MAG: oxidoreductase, partial [Flammeovirgaceae bacterium]|nr:oxidoreductase [Flammeovirgaceae bacterium]
MAFGLFKKSEPSPPAGRAGKEEHTHYHNLKVKEIVRETKDAVSIVFENPTSGKINYKSGQFFTLIIPVQGKDVRRAYSLC